MWVHQMRHTSPTNIIFVVRGDNGDLARITEWMTEQNWRLVHDGDLFANVKSRLPAGDVVLVDMIFQKKVTCFILLDLEKAVLFKLKWFNGEVFA